MDQKWWWPKSHTSKCKSSTMVNLKLAKLQNLNLMFTKIKYAIKRKYFVILEKLTRISANFKLIYKADVMLLTSLNEIEGLSYILRLRISKQRFWNLFHRDDWYMFAETIFMYKHFIWNFNVSNNILF